MKQISDIVFQQQAAIGIMIGYFLLAGCMIAMSIMLMLRAEHLSMAPFGMGIMFIGFALARYEHTFVYESLFSVNVLTIQGVSILIGVCSAFLCVIRIWKYKKVTK